MPTSSKTEVDVEKLDTVPPELQGLADRMDPRNVFTRLDASACDVHVAPEELQQLADELAEQAGAKLVSVPRAPCEDHIGLVYVLGTKTPRQRKSQNLTITFLMYNIKDKTVISEDVAKIVESTWAFGVIWVEAGRLIIDDKPVLAVGTRRDFGIETNVSTRVRYAYGPFAKDTLSPVVWKDAGTLSHGPEPKVVTIPVRPRRVAPDDLPPLYPSSSNDLN